MWSWGRYLLILVVTGVGGLLGGCGLSTPDIVEFDNQPHASAFLINRIVNHVKCELRQAVQHAHNYDIQQAALQPDKKRRIAWLDGSVPKVTIKLVVDEKGTLNPGASFKQLLPSDVTTFANKTTVTTPQSFSLGIGGLLSADATRTENVDYTFVVKSHFLDNQTGLVEERECRGYDGILLEGDLKIKDWLDGVTFPYYLPQNVDPTPPDVLSHEVAFVVVASGNITPTWSLVRVSANTAGSLAAAGRTKTGDVIISLGQPKAGTVDKAHDIEKLNSGFSTAVRISQPQQ
jgi:hypothetical protein